MHGYARRTAVVPMPMPKTNRSHRKRGQIYTSIVDQWLDTLPASVLICSRSLRDHLLPDRNLGVRRCDGLQGRFSDMARWVKLKYRKLNRRDILNSEIVALHSDIQELRMAITSGELKGDHGAARLALEKELRSHIETSERLNKSTDKRGLILAGPTR